LSIVVTEANRHDVSQLEAASTGRVAAPIMRNEKEKFCADAGYANDEPKQKMIAAGYAPHIWPRGEEKLEKMMHPDFKARRWIVETCLLGFNRFRKLTM
jgi:hypothetical protein